MITKMKFTYVTNEYLYEYIESHTDVLTIVIIDCQFYTPLIRNPKVSLSLPTYRF